MGSIAPKLDLWSNYLNTIDGKLVGTTETRHSINPATGNANPEVPVATKRDVDNAVDAGLKAFKTWSRTSWDERKRCMLAFADAVEEHAEEFAKVLTMEQGKPVS